MLEFFFSSTHNVIFKEEQFANDMQPSGHVYVVVSNLKTILVGKVVLAQRTYRMWCTFMH